jgi:hypothetical protein
MRKGKFSFLENKEEHYDERYGEEKEKNRYYGWDF